MVVDKPLGLDGRAVLLGHVAEVHAQAMLRIVLEQRVVPRRAMTILVDRVRCDAAGVAPDRRAARRVRDEEAVADDLREQARVLRLGATGAGTGELEQRLLELACLDVGGTCQLWLLGDVGDAVVEDLLLGHLVLDGHHRERVTRTCLDAHAAAHAIERADGERVLETGLLG